VSSRLGGRTIRATSVILALRPRKMEPNGISDGVEGGMILGALAGRGDEEVAGFRMKGESASSGVGIKIETGVLGGGCGAGGGEIEKGSIRGGA